MRYLLFVGFVNSTFVSYTKELGVMETRKELTN
jgi:hypothetical protein